MTNTEKFNETVGILVQAYLNDNLEHTNCCACAVGNLVAHAMGYKIIKTEFEREWNVGIKETYWFDGVMYGKACTFHREITRDKAFEQYAAIGYSQQEVALIEYAFEGCDRGSNEDEFMFNGLMAVVDVLAEIHSINLEQTQKARELFVK